MTGRGGCNLGDHRRELPLRWWGCHASSTRAQTPAWWACRQRRPMNSASSSPVAKAPKSRVSSGLFTGLRMTLHEPIGDGAAQLVELARKKMVGIIHDDQLVIPGKRSHKSFHFIQRAELIFASLNEKLRLLASR